MTAGARVAATARLQGTHALVVDDDEDLLELLEITLSAHGMRPLVARSGDEAFATFLKGPPDLVISDIRMANGSGFDLIRRIRAFPPDRGGLTPAIALSGTATPEETLEAGFHFHLTKPPSTSALVEAIGSFVSIEPAGHEAWSIGFEDRALVVRLNGYVTGGDMRAMTSALVPLLRASKEGCFVISDLRKLSSFAPSVGVSGQLGLWRVRDKIRSLLVVGGSPLARAVSRGACIALGIPCSFAASPPGGQRR